MWEAGFQFCDRRATSSALRAAPRMRVKLNSPSRSSKILWMQGKCSLQAEQPASLPCKGQLGLLILFPSFPLSNLHKVFPITHLAMAGEYILRVPRSDNGGGFVLVNVVSHGASPLDLKLLATEGDNPYVVKSELVAFPTLDWTNH